MGNQLNFDTLDILAAAIGVAIAFMLLPQSVERTTERIVVPLSMLVPNGLFRAFFACYICRY